MIRRTLVPRDLRFPPPETTAKPRRQSSLLDARFVVPGNLPVTPLDPKSKIPSHVPFDVLSTRTLVPRDLPPNPLGEVPRIPEFVPLTVLDARVVVPSGLEPGKLETREPLPPEIFEEIVQPDVITTGEVQLLGKPEEERPSGWNVVSRFGSLAVHIAMILFVISIPKLFPPHVPTQEEMELARRQLSFVYLPPSVTEVPKVPSAPQAPSEKMRIDPRILHQVAPPNVEPAPLPGPPREAAPDQPNLPAAPTPQIPVERPQPKPSPERAQQSSPFEDIPSPKPSPTNGLLLPRVSPGKALEETLKDAIHNSGPTTGGFADPIPRQGPGGGGGGGGGQGLLGGNLEMLTPTEGVDFSNYLARLLASVRRNWYAVIPVSAQLGEKGRVVLQFKIMRGGSVPFPEPILVRTSGKEPLDEAAMAAIRASNPFEPLPPAFSGPYIELRFTFLYNLPLDYQ